MVRIQNKNIPWTQIRLKSGKVVQTDGAGVLEGISEEEANFLGSTPGWHPPTDTLGEITTKPSGTPNVPFKGGPPQVKPSSQLAGGATIRGPKPKTTPAAPPAADAATAPAPEVPTDAPAEDAPHGDGGEQPSGEEAAAPEGPDVDGLRTKADALKIAAEWGVKDVVEGMSLADMKKKLNKAIYDED